MCFTPGRLELVNSASQLGDFGVANFSNVLTSPRQLPPKNRRWFREKSLSSKFEDDLSHGGKRMWFKFVVSAAPNTKSAIFGITFEGLVSTL